MTSESDEFLHRANIKDFDKLVSRGCRDEVTGRTPVACLNGILVSVTIEAGSQWESRIRRNENVQRGENLRGTRVPELDEVVLAAGD